MSPTGSEDSVPISKDSQSESENSTGLARESSDTHSSLSSSGEGGSLELVEEHQHPVPEGNYKFVSWDMDTTGRLLLDEICHIGAFYPGSNEESKKFSQYVMPFRNPNPGAVRRHHLRVVSTDRYRMLKDLKSGKMLRTKSEITAITDFIDWLGKVQHGTESDGIILVAYETRDVNAMLLLQAVEKYNLMEQFQERVKGLVNGFDIASRRCDKTLRSLSLRTLAKVLVNEEDNDRLDNASLRAQLLMEVMERVMETPDRLKFEHVKDVATTVPGELEALNRMRQTLRKQGGLRPIFDAPLRQGVRARQKMTYFRRVLAEADLDYDGLKDAHNSGLESLESTLKGRLNQMKPKDLEELVALMETHFKMGPVTIKKEPKEKKIKA